MFNTHGLARHPGIGHSQGMFSFLRVATASFNETTHRHELLILLRIVLVVKVPVVRPQKPQGSGSPRILGSVTTSSFCKCTAT